MIKLLIAMLCSFSILAQNDGNNDIISGHIDTSEITRQVLGDLGLLRPVKRPVVQKPIKVMISTVNYRSPIDLHYLQLKQSGNPFRQVEASPVERRVELLENLITF